MSKIRLAGRDATVLWEGDVIVLGAGLVGITSAIAAARGGKSTCLLESGPTLGVEISACYCVENLPLCDAVQRMHKLCAEKGVAGKAVDILLATIAFDRIVEEAGVMPVVRVQPMRPVTDKKGFLIGVEVVGKSGRQLVKAPCVFDATPGRVFSHRAAGQKAPVCVGAERRMYVHGLKETAGLPSNLGFSAAAWPSEAVLSVSMDVTPAMSEGAILFETHRQAVDAIARLRKDTRFSQVTLVDVAPRFLPRYARSRTDLSALEDTGLIPLPLAATLKKEIAEAMPCLLTMFASMTRKALPAVQLDGDLLETSELAADTAWDFAPAILPEVAAELHEPIDVAVAGYGTGGLFAALAAAEQEVSVTALDPAPVPGGIATAGKIHGYYHGLPGGMQDRLDEQAAGQGAALAPDWRGFHPVAKADVFLDALRTTSVAVYPGHTVFGVIKKDRLVQGLVSAGANGYHVFPCKVAIDATGDADVAAAAGAVCSLGRDGDGFPQPFSYTPSWMQEGKLHHHNFDAGWVDPRDTLDFSRAHFEGRWQIWERGRHETGQHYMTLASILGLRESRFIHGPLRLNFANFLDGKHYPDTVCHAYAHYDNHARDYAMESDWARRYVTLFNLWRFFLRGEVPYRALYPADVDGLLMACRALSVDHDLHQLLRMMRDLQKVGEISGLAAAMAVKHMVPPAQVDVDALREQLAKRGLLPAEPVVRAMDLPADQLVQKLGTDQDERGLAMYRLSRLPLDQAPDWEAFFANEQETWRRFDGAVVVALSDNPDDACRDVLRQAVESRVDLETTLQPGILPRYQVAALALAEIQDPHSVDLIAELLQDETLPTATIQLLLKGLELAGDPRGIEPIRAFLAQIENRDFASVMHRGQLLKHTSYRYAVEILAVKVLLALGCREELNRLVPYCQSEYLLIRRYARNVLATVV